jgi:uncharacterized protein (TIGR02145 family)
MFLLPALNMRSKKLESAACLYGKHLVLMSAPRSLIMRKNNPALMISSAFVMLFCSINSSAQPPERNQPNPVSKYLISVDKPAKIFIDTVFRGILQPGKKEDFTVFPGEHIVEAMSLDLDWYVKKTPEYVPPGEQIIVPLTLLPRENPLRGVKGSFKDPRDGKEYRTVTINDTTWFAENLNFNSGKSVCADKTETDCSQYGSYYLVEDAMTACPAGWHLPTPAEWEKLLSFYPGEYRNFLQEGGVSNFNLTRYGEVRIHNHFRLTHPRKYIPVLGRGAGAYWSDAPTIRPNEYTIATVLYIDPDNIRVNRHYRITYRARETNGGYRSALNIRCVRN